LIKSICVYLRLSAVKNPKLAFLQEVYWLTPLIRGNKRRKFASLLNKGGHRGVNKDAGARCGE
jgi:hypothetical protein